MRPELLAPAGSPEALRAAVQNGADAVYLGFGPLNARRNAKNFTREQLEEQLDQACEQRRRLGRVYGALGVTAGAVLMILFV